MADPFLGEIKVFAGNFAPFGWAMCDGRLLSIAQFTALFSLVGTTYGGDGVQTFGLPDLRGRVVVNQGQGPGLSPYTIGQQAGVENVTVLAQQLPSHGHSLSGSTAAASSPTPGTTVTPGTTATGEPIYGTAGSPVGLSPQSTTPSGGNQPHDNIQPVLAISYIIATQGVFPTRN